ncbi:hypothetical protein BLA23254_04802 [Burkholderia lata]|uniref:Uncharacterized protein n=1 Tax=Burkholderia lata (strain ATCC 17760 / DSM 23089 / LMG 22485 / NCIMB 9086 / R18194 / 383) TaxID=482957 RepID=A0A6P2P214_BURL3|nr:hypothetical protein [Burkholderia lata]VWC00900.1 hypothetical protein BLA23254_04802 [Burkholderia lata]
MSYPSTSFILSAIDPDLLYPCLEVRFETDDLDALRRLVDPDAPEDADLDDYYLLSPAQVAAICEAFSIAFDHGSRDAVISKYADKRFRIPYLIHTGYELALMVQGRKPFGFIEFNSEWRPSVVLKARFDEYVAQGVLHSHEILLDAPARPGRPARRIGQVLYTLKGEEWRIEALEFFRKNLNLHGDGCENMERLEGALLGYERWQNDWWIDHLARSGSSRYGASSIVKVDRAQFDWLVHAGFRALPPVDAPTFTLYSSHWFDEDAMKAAMRNDQTIEAFVQFNVGLVHIMHAADFRTAGPYEIPATLIPTINQHLLRAVRGLIRRSDCVEPSAS